MDNNIKVSVIVITYNQEIYIRQALESILKQNVNFRYEILVGDDASNDRTPVVVKEYYEKYPEIIVPVLRGKNVGAARNAYELCRLAKGDYLAFCEGDDFWISEKKLQSQVDFLDNHQDYIGCYNHCIVVDKDANALLFQLIRWVKYKNRFQFKDFEGGLFLPGQSSSIVKRNIFKNSDQDLSLLYKCDKDISDRAANMIYLLEGDFHCIDLGWSAYRVDEFSKTGSITYQKFKKNDDKILLDFDMTKSLEEYATFRRNEKIVFSKKRCQILAKSIIMFFIKPCGKRFKVMKTVFSDKGTPWYGFLYTPVFVFARILQDIWYMLKGYCGF